MLTLLAIGHLVGVFYVLATGKLPFTWQGEAEREGQWEAGWEEHPSAAYKVILYNDDHTPMDQRQGALQNHTESGYSLPYSTEW